MSVNEFARSEYNYRGTKFIFQEADVATYDKCLKKATSMHDDPVSGQEVEDVDENLLLRLLMRECLIQPKSVDFNTIGIRLMRQLERDVRALHFADEPTTRGGRKAKDDDEDDDSPNAES